MGRLLATRFQRLASGPRMALLASPHPKRPANGRPHHPGQHTALESGIRRESVRNEGEIRDILYHCAKGQGLGAGRREARKLREQDGLTRGRRSVRLYAMKMA